MYCVVIYYNAPNILMISVFSWIIINNNDTIQDSAKH